ncbi:MAG: hypothetical protein HQ510_05915, partial [Candidatus Marinimicrobia bacterium]|nr:hypothetical protein [Candidatus Neomarinimicrobiota bacterium]
ESEWYVDYRYQVRGVDDNDIFVVGYNSEIMHYNGDTWEQINYFEGDYLDNIQVTENTVIVGGHRFEGGASVRALLLHGTRGE